MTPHLQVSFSLKKGKANALGKAPIYCRITMDKIRSEFTTKQMIQPNKWNADGAFAKGTSGDIKQLNNRISKIKTDLYKQYEFLRDSGKLVNVEALKNLYFGIAEKQYSIVETFDYHNNQMKELIGKDYASGTYERFQTSKRHTIEFLNNYFKKSDALLSEIDHKFINDYMHYLKVNRSISHNTATKYLTNFKKIVLLGYKNGWIKINPFMTYKFKLAEIERDFLTTEELQRIADYNFHNGRLQVVADIFLFCCYTGLAFVDVKKLSLNHITTDLNGNKIIKLLRTKTDTRSVILIIDRAQEIINKYANHEKRGSKDKLLPVNTNQIMNSYLKEIAALCNIDKKITMHVARHTFATTVALLSGLPIESVSKALGHTNIKTTQHYAKILDHKVVADMQILNEVFKSKKQENFLKAVV